MNHGNRLPVLLLLASAIWISVLTVSAAAVGDQELVFQEELTVDGNEYRLVTTNTMNAKAFFMTIKICELGHYVQTDAVAQGLVEKDLLTSDDVPKIMEMRFQKKIEPSEMHALFEGIFDSAAEQLGDKVPDEDLKKFMGLLDGAEKGASLLLVRDPGGALSLIYDGKTSGSVNSIGICTALWSVLIP